MVSRTSTEKVVFLQLRLLMFFRCLLMSRATASSLAQFSQSPFGPRSTQADVLLLQLEQDFPLAHVFVLYHAHPVFLSPQK
jgi:hypothetical protein